MQPRIEVLETLIRHCRLLRQSADVEKVRAVLDVEEDLSKKLTAAGGTVPATLSDRVLNARKLAAMPRKTLVAAGGK